MLCIPTYLTIYLFMYLFTLNYLIKLNEIFIQHRLSQDLPPSILLD